MNKGYPPEWVSGEIQREIYERAGWKCEHCGIEFFPGTTKAKEALNANGNPANCDWTNLLACCQVCHLHIQAVWRPGGVLPAHWEQPPRWISERGLEYIPNGQLSLWNVG